MLIFIGKYKTMTIIAKKCVCKNIGKAYNNKGILQKHSQKRLIYFYFYFSIARKMAEAYANASHSCNRQKLFSKM